MSKFLFAGAAVLAAITIAHAEPNTVNGPDLLIDLDRWTGTEVQMRDIAISHADNSGAIVKSNGVRIKISTQGIDKDTFRKILTDCNAWITSSKCQHLNIVAVPTGEKTLFDWPILSNVRLVPGGQR
jgi:hypothetical protein